MPGDDDLAFSRVGIALPAPDGLLPRAMVAQAIDETIHVLIGHAIEAGDETVAALLQIALARDLRDPETVFSTSYIALVMIVDLAGNKVDLVVNERCDTEDQALDVLRQHQTRLN